MTEPLHVVYTDSEIVIDPTAGLEFGRGGDFSLDDNPYLHRHLGSFEERSGVWWLLNVGRAIVMELSDQATPGKLSIGPGSASPIPFRRSFLRFQAGSASYELEITAPTVLNEIDQPDVTITGVSTMTAAAVPLNAEQRLLLVALAEKRLRDRSAPVSELPTNREVTTMLGWSTTKFNRKLDNLCGKFERLGVAGLKGDLGELAKGRRERLVDHVLTVQLIDETDLSLLDRCN